jgi:hypothetical protein
LARRIAPLFGANALGRVFCWNRPAADLVPELLARFISLTELRSFDFGAIPRCLKPPFSDGHLADCCNVVRSAYDDAAVEIRFLKLD